jgi:hypothetical protein
MSAYRPVGTGRSPHVSQYLNWVAAMGVVLIGSGFGLVVLAVRGARSLAPARHRRRTGHSAGRRPAPVSGYRRGVASPTTSVPLGGVPAVAVRLPRIERSALLADTIRLNQAAPPAQSPLPITLSITLPVATQRSRT